MKKKLFTLLLCAFAVVSANAWTVSQDGDKAIITGNGNESANWSDISSTDQAIITAATTLEFHGTVNTLKPFENVCGNATTVDFSAATFPEEKTGTKSYQAWDAENKSYYSATVDVYSNCMTFSIFPNVSTAKLASVKTLCPGLFKGNSMVTTTFTIPSSVEYIATLAVENTPIHDITIPATVKYIDTQAFQNASIDHLIEVTVDGYTSAAHGAFDKDVTVGQTQADGTRVYATLHFKEGAEEFFTNTQHELDLKTSLDAGLFQSWLNQHYEKSGNGWQDFINSAPGKGTPVDKPVVLRTFSDNVAHYVPLCYRAYIVNGVSGDREHGYTLELQEIFGIPANTGVIIYGEAESGSFALPILSGASWQTNPYDRTENSTVVDNHRINLQNFLVANCTLASGKKIGPYELSEDKQSVAERNFVLGRYAKTDLFKDKFPGVDPDEYADDYVAFFRAKSMTPGKNKAHLKVPNSIFSEPKGVELIAVNPTDFREDEWFRKYREYGDWGQKASGIAPFQAKSFGEPFEDEYEATGISNVKSENTDDAAIYNLKGVKVVNPVKGVYVKAGKKIIIK